MIMLVSYDLTGPERPRSYEAVHTAIATHAGEGNYAQALYSQFLIDSNKSIDHWDAILDSVTDAEDCWLVTEITKNRAGTLTSDAVTWLAEHD
jgi:hypothetical protein